MKEKRERLQAIETRKLELRSDLENSEKEINLEEVNTELDTLNTEEVQIKEEIKVEEETRSNLAKGLTDGFKVVTPQEERGVNMTREEILKSKEYRNAFYKNLLGQKMEEAEERAFAVAGTDGVLPVEASEEVIKKLATYAPMLDEITLLHVKGNVKFAVEGTKTEGKIHTENGSITADSDTLVTVSLGGYEVTKLIQVSKSVETMSVNSFEAWLTDMIAEMIGAKIEDQIFNGTGTNQAKGIDKITWANGTNAINIAKDAAITADNVRSLVALLPAGYDTGAKMYMTKKTLFNRIMGLQDSAKHDLVKSEGNKYYVYGYEVKLSDKAPENEIILGNSRKYVGNLAEEMNVVKDFDINTNSNKYLGCAMFDGKPAVEEAFVKIVQLTV